MTNLTSIPRGRLTDHAVINGSKKHQLVLASAI